ncbi:ClpP/crotonase-like domain-containing protein [Ilyonectria robusta]|uniref:ClpP/crotonase-like domain-containing protein n=1 Tax=Ilyonectria robusta TaxID=1079257 RepID=UPI001E8E1BD2|nr:ClpP/crotonase-like domain-containing protein [Ilyonectria robusta]KAH8679482.1 ClpP/crotonase-like domain-containing protein [Ilyonectria robusta]
MELPTYTNILVQLIQSNHIALVKLNRPQSGNSLQPQLLSELGSALKVVNNHPELNRTLILSEKVIIAAVNGPAVGYSVSTPELYDLVYSVPDAYLFTPFVKQGMATEGASSFSFPFLMGHQRAAALFLAGERITAQEARDLGLINKIFPKDTFFPSVMEIAESLSRSPPGSLKATKRLMKEPVWLWRVQGSRQQV